MVLMIIITVILKQEYILNISVNSGYSGLNMFFLNVSTVLGWIGFDTSMDSDLSAVVVFVYRTITDYIYSFSFSYSLWHYRI